MGHLSSSLRQLTENLKNSDHDFPLMRQSKHLMTLDEDGLYEVDENKLDIAKQKGYFPYKFCTSLAKVKTTYQLPLKHEWDDTLGGETSITDSELEFAQLSWDTFNCNDLYDYMLLYCLIDTVRKNIK